VTFSARDFFGRFIAALNASDYTAVESFLHPDLIVDMAQSGERSRGPRAFMEQLVSYPGVSEDALQVTETQILGDDERWAITPGYTVVPLTSPNEFTSVFRTQYPDGSWWWVVAIFELRDEKIYRLNNFFAPALAAPLPESIAAFPHG